MKNYSLYIIYNKEIDKYYVGITNNIERRIFEHNNHSDKKRFTSKQKGIWQLAYTENFDNLSLAKKR